MLQLPMVLGRRGALRRLIYQRRVYHRRLELVLQATSVTAHGERLQLNQHIRLRLHHAPAVGPLSLLGLFQCIGVSLSLPRRSSKMHNLFHGLTTARRILMYIRLMAALFFGVVSTDAQHGLIHDMSVHLTLSLRFGSEISVFRATGLIIGKTEGTRLAKRKMGLRRLVGHPIRHPIRISLQLRLLLQRTLLASSI